MFGKGKRVKSSNERFIIRAGIDAGNLKGRGKADKTAPMAKGSSLSMPDVEGVSRPRSNISKGKSGPMKFETD